jgi:hypothetical protein
MSDHAGTKTDEKTDSRLGSYGFAAASTIAQMDVEKGLSGGFQIVLHPSAQADAATLTKLPDTLAGLKAYGAYVSTRDDKPVFVVPQVSDHGAFTASLQKAGLAQGAGKYQQVENTSPKGNAIEKMLHFLQDHTLEAAGIAGGVGYAALGIDGYVRGDKFLMGTGLAALCPLIVAIWGQGDKSGELTRLVGDVQNYLKDQGIEVPEQKFTAEQKHALSGLGDFFKEHPVEISYALANIATAALWMQGLKEFKDDGAWTKLCTASSTLVGNTIVAMFPEKHAKPVSEMSKWELQQRASRNPLEALRDKIQESPLLVHGFLNFFDVPCWLTEFSEDSFKGGKIGNFEYGRSKKLHELREGHAALENDINSLGKEARELASSQKSPLTERQKLHFHNRENELYGKMLDKEDSMAFLANETKDFLGGTMTKAEASGVLKAIVATGLSLQIILGGMSHKSKSEAEQIAGFDKVFAASAKMLAEMPEVQRAVVLEQTSAFLAMHKSTGGLFTPDKVKKEISKRLDVLQKAEWIQMDPLPEAANNITPITRNKPEIQVSSQQLDGKVASIALSPSLAG